MPRENITNTLDIDLYNIIKQIAKELNMNANDLIEKGMKFVINDVQNKNYPIDLSIKTIKKNTKKFYQDSYNITIRKFCEDLGFLKADVYKKIRNKEIDVIKKKTKGKKLMYYILDEHYEYFKKKKSKNDLEVNDLYQKLNLIIEQNERLNNNIKLMKEEINNLSNT